MGTFHLYGHLASDFSLIWGTITHLIYQERSKFSAMNLREGLGFKLT
jgi:hypothetical protein